MTVETMPRAEVGVTAPPAPASSATPSAAEARPGRGAGDAALPPLRAAALARGIVRLFARTLPPGSGLTAGLDGEGPAAVLIEATAGGGPDPNVSESARRARIRVHGPAALARLLPPTENSFADAYLRGDIDIDGDIAHAIGAARDIDLRRLTADEARRLTRWSLELWRAHAGGGAAPIARAARLRGRRHSPERDAEAVRFHYDVGEAFFQLWLDRRLTYSCAYFEHDDDPARDLDAAQEAKLDLVCRKLDLRPGQRLLDIGCGWGSLLLHAAERYKVEAIGVTLSQRQADEANRRAELMGLDRRVRAEVRDYRDLAELGAFDAVASIGMFEHVGAAALPVYFAAAYGALKPGGRFLNHGIATAERGLDTWRGHAGWRGGLRRATFNERYVFPDGELVPVERAVAVARDLAGFEVIDLQSLRPHYALTLRAWGERLEGAWDRALAAAGPEVARTWRLYMAGARVGFERGELDVAQLLLAKPDAAKRPARRPSLRPWW
jgi:cyclopropane-fatty-acyl-phospholipid synthase